MPDYETMYNELKEYNDGLEQEDFSCFVTEEDESLLCDDNQELNFE